MSYQVLALKYRPQTFDDVVGQSHVTTTLVNAVLQDRVAHAILFTGPRGTGKTTIARILAKAMNCTTGPTPAPCNQCKSCTEIIAGHSADVFEIDGASNNSVDQVRDLRENVTYMPAAAPYKIYIIDEVHMLSTAAFNALLKTLEEPPDHVLFIFATTEVHKIPATILSRCQRHDLARIPLDAISGLLKKIWISHAMVVDRLGVPDRRIMHELTQALFDKDVPALITLVDRVNDTGMDLKKFYGDLIGHVRHMTVIRQCGPDHPAVHLTSDEKQRIHALVANLPDAYPGQLLQVLLTDEDMVKRTAHTRIAIETVLFKLLQVRSGASIDRIIRRLDLLARQVRSGETGTGTHPGEAGPSPADRPAKSASATSVPPVAPAYPPAAAPDTPVNGVREPADPAPPPAPDMPRTWDGFLTRIKTQMPSLHKLLSRGRITSETENALELHLSDCTDFDRKRLTAKRKELDRQCQTFLGRTLTIHVASDTRPAARNGAGPEDMKARQAAVQHPLVQHAQELFNGEIINF